MSSGVNLNKGSQEAIISKLNFITIKQNAIEIAEKVLSEFNVISVVTVERRLYIRRSSPTGNGPAEEKFENPPTDGLMLWSRCVALIVKSAQIVSVVTFLEEDITHLVVQLPGQHTVFAWRHRVRVI
mmetsp:Transcript_16626/g.46951  ORF Transcript_16626/g.46951 Transcript_16626/m.46951 type:complete len:127 (-) Transcript_16626:187-567(-)